MSLQYLKKAARDEVDFLHADKQSFLQVDFDIFRQQSFLQSDTILIDGHDQAFSKCSK